ncbi:hypothetical protein BC832DRAFT_105945 [Gaertneriomyces semiglobifer]|nr:hypothetical protein BC832DRAFT_105945 [Gaertneriomyces semiglobifer]
MIFASEEWLNVFGIHLGVFDHGLNRISTLTIDSLHDDDIHDENESLLPEAREENVQGARGILRSSDRALTPTPTNSPHSSRAAPPSVDPSLSSASSRYPRIAYSKLLPPNTDFTSISFPFSRYTACIAAEDLASMHSRMTAAIEDGQPFHCVQRIYREVDRRETYVQVYVKPVKAPKSSVVLSLRGTAQDITDRVQQELELIRAKEAALTESRHKDNFLSTMSHELRTPLTSIIGHVELMEETPLDDIQREYVSTARKGAVSLLALINDILDYSKLSANRIDLEARPTHLQEILLDIRAIVSNMGKDVDMIFEPYNGPLFISDGMRMKQILMNLINNAIKFTPEKGTVNIRNSHRINDDGEVEVQITVADSGIGMPEEVLQRLFKPFMQADATTSRRFGGTGLGLSIVKSLVTAMRGTISVSSQEGVGSTFVVNFIFPLAPVEPPPSIVVPTIRIPKRKLRLLVTEDNCVTQQLIRRMLREYATVEVANNGLEAVEFVTGAPVTDPKFTRSATLNTLLGTTISQPPPVLLKGDQIDVMLCDLNMPVMDGLEAVQRIRAWEESRRSTHPEYKPVYIIGLTANAFSTDRDSCLSAGMNDYLSKPFSKSALIEKVCNAIGDGD